MISFRRPERPQKIGTERDERRGEVKPSLGQTTITKQQQLCPKPHQHSTGVVEKQHLVGLAAISMMTIMTRKTTFPLQISNDWNNCCYRADIEQP
mmetsp:Transcript_5157/g.12946  ORF Transcript_5157/g.12946 Transcript_5157/m.12946 type:complete len:95 (+) Transcript_5157:95-379(+)